MQLVASGLTKTFGDTHAVNDVSITFSADAVTALIGGNGAGKSTFARMITGELAADKGSARLGDTPLDIYHASPRAAHDLGIRIVHQELSLCPSLTVAENFYVELGKYGNSRRWRHGARELVRESLQRFVGEGLSISPDDRVEDLSLAECQLVEIVRAVSAPGLRVLFLDEPTASLNMQWMEGLRELIKRLREAGVIVIIVTHKLQDIPLLADRVAVMREGKLVAQEPVAAATESALVGWMTIGEANEGAASSTRPAANRADATAEAEAGELPDSSGRGNAGQTLLKVDRLNDASLNLHNCSIEVKAGEIVGLAGLEGAGQVGLLASVQQQSHHAVAVSGEVAYITGNRRDEGIFPLWDATRNLAISVLSRRKFWQPFGSHADSTVADPWLRRLNIPAAADRRNIANLSGGMQQKDLVARGLATGADLLLLNDPTRGVDIPTKHDIYRLLREAADEGKGVLWYSSEDAEMTETDRVYVMAEGAVVDEFETASLSQDQLVSASFRTSESDHVERDVQQGEATGHKFGSRLLSLRRQRYMLALIGLVLMLILVQISEGGLGTYSGINNVFEVSPALVFAGLAEMFVMALNDIDFGVGAYMGFVTVIASTSLQTRPLEGVLLLLAGVAAYCVVGAVVYLRSVPAIVMTLGMSFVWLGVAMIIQPVPGGMVPDWLSNVVTLNTPLLPVPLYILVISGLVAYFLITRTRIGTLIRAVGSNVNSVRSAGWSVLSVRIAAWAAAGVAGTLAGLMFAAIATAGDANATSGDTLMAVGGVVVGGTDFLGGRVSATGAVIGGVLMSLIGVLLTALGVSPNYTEAAEGLVLLVVMAFRLIMSMSSQRKVVRDA
jgi:ribose transport system ATP-binding protein